MALEICGDQAIFMPEEQCDSCEQFMSDIQRLDRAVANTYTKAEVDALIADVEHVHLVEVDVLPATGEDNIIYLVPRSSGTGKEMWIYSNDVWHDLGPTTVDLSNYYTKAEVDAMISDVDTELMGKQAKLTAGDGITITDENVISAERNATNTYTKTEINDLLATELSDYYTASQTDGLLNGKVDKVSGMGLSQNSYTTAEKNKLSALPTAASLNTLLSNKQDKLTFDNIPTNGSNNPVKSDGVYDRFVKSDSNIAPIETSPATAAHAVGESVVLDGALYTVTAAVNSGDTLVVGANISAISALGVVDETASLVNLNPQVIVRATRVGAVVQITGQCTLPASAIYLSIFVLPARLKPNGIIIGSAIYYANNLEKPASAIITALGNCNISNPDNVAGSTIYFTVIYTLG